MSLAGGSKSKSTRGFGDFAPAAKASSLFDAAFSKPVPKKRFQKAVIPQEAAMNASSMDDSALPSVSDLQHRNSPKQVFSPPVSLPESNSTDGAMDQISDSDSEEARVSPIDSLSALEVESNSQSSTSSLDNKFNATLLSSPEKPKNSRSATSAFDFDEELTVCSPVAKRQKQDVSASLAGAKFIPPKLNRPKYEHKWSAGGDDEFEFEEEDKKEVSTSAGRPLTYGSNQGSMRTVTVTVGGQQRRIPVYALGSGGRVRNVKEAHQCLESGEHDDFKHDLEYILSTLRDESSMNVKCLSAISLARKCISSEFRQFVRSEGQVNHLFKAMAEAPESKSFALCAATVIYLMSRDFISMKVDTQSLRLLTQLLRIESMDNDPEQSKYRRDIWKVFSSYLERMEASGKMVLFEIDEKHLTPSALVLEALVFVLGRGVNDESLKTELLNLGVLQWVVSKVEKITLRFLHDSLQDDQALQQILLLERCFRILESCTFFHKKNQAFLISHRGSVLIQTCGKMMTVIHSAVTSTADVNENLIGSYMNCLARIARVLMNLSHENELCSTKLGQMPGFLSICLTSLTYLTPRYAAQDKKFDMYVMLTSLLVNLVERCNSNRRKLIDSTVKTYSQEVGESEEKGIDALTTIFCNHEAKAKNIDEDLDKDLAFEEPTEEDLKGDDDDEETVQTGRLDRGKLEAGEMSEGEMMLAVQKAMTKASAHMEDSVVASYAALLIGCLLQQNEECASAVRSRLEGGSLASMIEQLQRFLEFMKIASSKHNGCRSIERIIDLLESL